MALAGLGLALSLIVHVTAIVGMPALFGKATWGLHVGVFLVWFPAVLASISMTRGANRSQALPLVLRNCPRWMRYTTFGLAGYAVLNFILFVAGVFGNPKDESVVLHGFSGHWMIFYAAAFAILYSYGNTDPSAIPRCANGHAVSFTASFCEKCGKPVVRKRT